MAADRTVRQSQSEVLLRAEVAAAKISGERLPVRTQFGEGHRPGSVSRKEGVHGVESGQGFAYASGHGEAIGFVPGRVLLAPRVAGAEQTITVHCTLEAACTVRAPFSIENSAFVVRTDGSVYGAQLCIEGLSAPMSRWMLFTDDDSYALTASGCVRGEAGLPLEAAAKFIDPRVHIRQQPSYTRVVTGSRLDVTLDLAAFLLERLEAPEPNTKSAE